MQSFAMQGHKREHHVNFAILSQRMVTFFTPGVQRKLWKVHVNYPMDTCRDDVPAGQPKTGQDSKS